MENIDEVLLRVAHDREGVTWDWSKRCEPCVGTWTPADHVYFLHGSGDVKQDQYVTIAFNARYVHIGFMTNSIIPDVCDRPLPAKRVQSVLFLMGRAIVIFMFLTIRQNRLLSGRIRRLMRKWLNTCTCVMCLG